MDLNLIPEVMTRTVDQLNNIFRVFGLLVNYIFNPTNDGFMKSIINTILGNSYLLISVSLLIVGFVVGLLSRMIHN